MLPVAGWYTHPSGAQLRWWDGAEWTDQYAPTAEAPAELPVDRYPAAQFQGSGVAAPGYAGAAHPAAGAAYPSAGVATADRPRWGTVWVWFLALSPYLTLATSLGALYGFARSETPNWQWLALLVLPYLAIVGSAASDGRTLRVWHGEAATWTWAFLGALPYLIARTIVLRRRGKFGSAPLWVALGNVLGTVLPLVLMGAAILLIISELSRSMS